MAERLVEDYWSHVHTDQNCTENFKEYFVDLIVFSIRRYDMDWKPSENYREFWSRQRESNFKEVMHGFVLTDPAIKGTVCDYIEEHNPQFDYRVFYDLAEEPAKRFIQKYILALTTRGYVCTGNRDHGIVLSLVFMSVLCVGCMRRSARMPNANEKIHLIINTGLDELRVKNHRRCKIILDELDRLFNVIDRSGISEMLIGQ